MIDQIIKLAKDKLGPDLQQKEQLNSQQVDKTMEVAGESFSGGLKSMASSGNVNQLLNLFNGKEDAAGKQSFTDSIIKKFVPSIGSKLGIDESKAQSIANSVVPFLVEKFSSEGGQAKDSGDLLQKLGIGGVGSITEKVGGFFK
jgi:uncharacterized protein YidB (DUF937 family)